MESSCDGEATLQSYKATDLYTLVQTCTTFSAHTRARTHTQSPI